MSYVSSTTRTYEGRVGAVHGGPRADPTAITYDVYAVNTPDVVELSGVTPAGRVASGVEILAAAVGDLCWIQLKSDGGHKVYVYETIPFEDCNTP